MSLLKAAARQSLPHRERCVRYLAGDENILSLNDVTAATGRYQVINTKPGKSGRTQRLWFDAIHNL